MKNLKSLLGKLNDTFQIVPPAPGVAMLGDLPLSYGRLLAFGLSLAVLIALIVFLRTNRLGRALRAVFQNREVARLRGIDTARMYRLAFVLGTAITTE